MNKFTITTIAVTTIFIVSISASSFYWHKTSKVCKTNESSESKETDKGF